MSSPVLQFTLNPNTPPDPSPPRLVVLQRLPQVGPDPLSFSAPGVSVGTTPVLSQTFHPNTVCPLPEFSVPLR